jgi:hypothetical protein
MMQMPRRPDFRFGQWDFCNCLPQMNDRLLRVTAIWMSVPPHG